MSVRNKCRSQLTCGVFAALLGMIIGFVFTVLIGITRLALVPVMDAVIDSDSINGINCLASALLFWHQGR